MKRLVLPNHGHGRLLNDSLLDSAALHPELFGFPDPHEDVAYLPDITDDPLLCAGIDKVLATYDEAVQCDHLSEVNRRNEMPGIKLYPEDVNLGCAVHIYAMEPRGRMCFTCWQSFALKVRFHMTGEPCERCLSAALPKDCAVVDTPVAHAIITFHVCGSCVADLEGSGHE
jgi:hypothetical protein